MALEINWIVSEMDRSTEDGLVTTVHWRAVGVDGEHSADVYGAIGLERGEDFVAFDDLTEEVVVGWVKDKLGEESVANYETSLANQIAEKKAPKTARGLPWANSGLSE